MADEAQIESDLAAGSEIGGDSLEALLAPLLSGLAGYRPRALDGVLVVQTSRADAATHTRALAILVDGQLVEPVTFTLSSEHGGHLAAGSTVQFGSSPSGAVVYGSAAHDRLRNRLLSEPPQVQWAHEFTRGPGGWSRSGGVA